MDEIDFQWPAFPPRVTSFVATGQVPYSLRVESDMDIRDVRFVPFDEDSYSELSLLALYFGLACAVAFVMATLAWSFGWL